MPDCLYIAGKLKHQRERLLLRLGIFNQHLLGIQGFPQDVRPEAFR